MVHIILLAAFAFSLPFINKRRPAYIISFFIIFIFSALRYNYGNDYSAYMKIYEAIRSGQEAWGSSDILFKMLNLSMPDFYVLIACISLFYIITIYYFISRNLNISEYWLSLLILLINPYMFLIHLSSIRQTIAICFFIIAVNFAIKRNIFFYMIFTAIAVGFHFSAITLIPLYFVLTEVKIKRIFMILICLGVLIIIITPLFEVIMERIIVFFPQYSFYFNQGQQNSLRSTILSIVLFIIIVINFHKLEGKEIVIGKLSLIATIISILAFKVSMIARFGMYFDIFLIATFPQIISKLKSKSYWIIIFGIILMIYALRYVSFFSTPGWSEYYGIYKTIFTK